MKISASWIFDNIILALFLGVQALVVVAALGWISYGFYAEHFPKTIKKNHVQSSIFVESSLSNSLKSEIATYKQLGASNQDFQIKSVSMDQSIQKFINNETELIFISRPLSEQEISQINPSRLPIAQQDFQIGKDGANQMVYLIHDNDYPLADQILTNAFQKKKDKLSSKQKFPG
jgi:hypothetical protein